jgi:hypothetical protein
VFGLAAEAALLLGVRELRVESSTVAEVVLVGREAEIVVLLGYTLLAIVVLLLAEGVGQAGGVAG